MRQTEQRLWDRFRGALRAAGAWHERVENLVAVGTPDVVGVGWWVELKAVAAPPARPGTPLLGKERGLNRDQIVWHHRYLAAGGRSYVLVGVGSGENLLIHGAYAPGVNACSLDELRRIAVGVANPAAGWASIIEELRQ